MSLYIPEFLVISLLMIFLPSCKKQSVPSGNAASAKSLDPGLSRSLDQEFSKAIRCEFRDVLINAGYPIGNVIFLEVSLSPKYIFHGNEMHFVLRSLVSKDSLPHYRPKLMNEADVAFPQATEVVVEHGDVVEVEQSFLVPRQFLIQGKRLLISNSRKENVLLSEIAMRYMQRAISAKRESDKSTVLTLPIEL